MSARWWKSKREAAPRAHTPRPPQPVRLATKSELALTVTVPLPPAKSRQSSVDGFRMGTIGRRLITVGSQPKTIPIPPPLQRTPLPLPAHAQQATAAAFSPSLPSSEAAAYGTSGGRRMGESSLGAQLSPKLRFAPRPARPKQSFAGRRVPKPERRRARGR